MAVDLEEVMYRSGFDNSMSILLAMRGPLEFRFKGKWYRPLYLFYTCFVEFASSLNYIPIWAFFFAEGNGVLERCLCAFPLTSISLSLFRVVYVSLRRPRFARLIADYDRLYRDSPRLAAEIEKSAKILRNYPRLMVLLTALPMSPWCFIPIVTAITGGPWVISVPSSWPFDPVSNIYLFSFVSFSQALSAGFNTLRVVLFDNMFAVYACRQLFLARELRHQLTKALSPGRMVSLSPTEAERRANTAWVVAQLRQWAINHQEALRLARELQELFSPCLAIQFAMICLSCCTTAFVVVFSNADLLNIALCFLYAVGNSLELLITCVIGDLITNESSELERSVEGTFLEMAAPGAYGGWLRTILIRARLPIRLSAFGVYPLGTETFKSVMATTYSFFTLLINMKERHG